MLSPSSDVPIEVNAGYTPEMWTWFILGVAVLLLRHAVRIRTVGIVCYQGDDYLSILALLLYTVDTTMGYHAYYAGGNVDVTADEVDSLSEHDIEVLTFGSKVEFATWYTYPAFVWVMKFSILFFYKRMTLGVSKERMVKALFCFCGLTWISVVLAVSLTCRPFSNNWTIRPLPGQECTFRPQNFYALAVLNIVTDVAILIIPAPMLWRLRIPLWRRIAVSLLLCGGLFVISAAIIRCALTLTARPSVLNINLWGYRETVIALLAVTAPVLSPLFRPGFWRRGPYVGARRWEKGRDRGAVVAGEEVDGLPRSPARRFAPGSWRRFGMGTSLFKSSFISFKSSFTGKSSAGATSWDHGEATPPVREVDVEAGRGEEKVGVKDSVMVLVPGDTYVAQPKAALIADAEESGCPQSLAGGEILRQGTARRVWR